jgi:hypothetical protein
MMLVFIGLAFLGFFSSAAAAVYVPRKKKVWKEDHSPRVRTIIKH